MSATGYHEPHRSTMTSHLSRWVSQEPYDCIDTCAKTHHAPTPVHKSVRGRLGVMPRLVSKSLSSRAARYIHCRPSPSPSVNVYSTPTCQGRACLNGSSRRPAPTPTRTHKHARTHTHAHLRQPLVLRALFLQAAAHIIHGAVRGPARPEHIMPDPCCDNWNANADSVCWRTSSSRSAFVFPRIRSRRTGTTPSGRVPPGAAEDGVTKGHR